MYVKGMNTSNISLVIALNAAETTRFLTRNDVAIDTKILENVEEQIKTRKAELPAKDDRIVLTISLSETEARKLEARDEAFEDHFLEVVTQQTENTERRIVRFEEERSSDVSSRQERRGSVKVATKARL